MIDLLPAVFWIVSIIWAVVVCVICVRRGKLLQPGHPDVEPVRWPVIGAQLASLILAMVPFVIGKVWQDLFGAEALAFYVSAAWPAGIVSVLLIGAELVLMILQAQRATYTEMGVALHAITRDVWPCAARA